MTHSINNQYIHLLLATKNLKPLILQDTQNALLRYISGTIKSLDGVLFSSVASSNHIHLLIRIPTDISISDFLNKLKACSSKWYRESHSDFNWNTGYCAFTVSPSSFEAVNTYFSKEAERHINQSYEDELTSFLKLHEIEYNPLYLTTTTFTRLIYHLVWSVKDRNQVLIPSLKNDLHQCIRKEINKCNGKTHAIENISDHIHILVELPSKISTACLVQTLKTTSTYLLRSMDKTLSFFCWQEGYGVFSVGIMALDVVVKYVNNQEAHHLERPFEQEWAAFQKKMMFE